MVASDNVVDAEDILSINVHAEATHPGVIEVPTSVISEVDVSEEEAVSAGFEFEESDLDSEDTIETTLDSEDDFAAVKTDEADEEDK